MTACATVADVLAIAPDPRRVSLSELRRCFGIGFDRARTLKALAVETQPVIAVMREYRMSEAEARDFLRMTA